MTNNIFKQASNSARDAAIKMAKQIVHEPVEILKGAKDQITGSESRPQTQGPSMMQEVMTEGGKVQPLTSNEEQSIHAQAKSRLAQIEAELRQIRMMRERDSQNWNREQDRQLNGDQQQNKQEFVAPPSKKQHGAQKPGQKKSATPSMETSRQKKG